MGDRDWVDAAGVRQRLDELVELGNSLTEIAEASGVARESLRRIFNGQSRRARREVEQAILGLPLTSFGQYELAWPSTRRLRALACAGFSQMDLAKASGLLRSTIEALQAERWRRVRAEDAVRVRALYESLRGVTGSSHRSLRAALDRGWAPPQAWSEAELDDVDPGTMRRVEVRWHARPPALSQGERLHQARLSADFTQRELAGRLGVSVSAVIKWENGVIRPRPASRRKLQDLLGWVPDSPDIA